MLFRSEVQFNDVNSAIKPELSILHSGGVKSENILPTNKTNITRFGLNGVYEFNATDSLIPFAKAGVGYETMSRQVADNSDAAFLSAGAGVKIPCTDELALKLETLYMLKNSSSGGLGDSNLALLAGLNYSFGEKAQKAAPIVDGDDDKDGVANSLDKCPTTPAGDMVDATGCTVDGDDDSDGVANSIDKCPTTPTGNVVDATGCTVEIGRASWRERGSSPV